MAASTSVAGDKSHTKDHSDPECRGGFSECLRISKMFQQSSPSSRADVLTVIPLITCRCFNSDPPHHVQMF